MQPKRIGLWLCLPRPQHTIVSCICLTLFLSILSPLVFILARKGQNITTSLSGKCRIVAAVLETRSKRKSTTHPEFSQQLSHCISYFSTVVGVNTNHTTAFKTKAFLCVLGGIYSLSIIDINQITNKLLEEGPLVCPTAQFPATRLA